MFRMKKLVFLELCDILETKYNLKKTRNVSIYEQVGLFLYMLSQPGFVHNCEERFQHSGETISRHFHNVLEAVCMFAKDIIKPVDPSFRDTPDEILKDARYRPYFRDCIGAIDGTHIRVCVPSHLQGVYIGRKGYTTTNVMAVCDFSMCFTFVWAGWEGSEHDTKIFMEALHKPALHFPHPPQGKYYLVDSGYPTFMSFLGPYMKTRYHLPQFRIGPRIRGRVEVFNYYHSSLQSTIERAFGLCKTRWKILGNMPPFALKTQNQIIVACMAIHNFIQRNDKSDGEFDSLDEDIDSDEDESEVGPSITTWEEPDAQSTLQMERFRESLKNMFPTRI
ncbi:putative nuclease HARBI1 [Glycine max]|uniref:putative nuclease HARBI1 n=1 Tax=Glycine max TaxID=3847 RepID=UPI001B357633|nr:putative nuclease HARBI1 [Glycine max]